MKVLLDGADPRSSSGPNSFARKLFDALTEAGHGVAYALGNDAWSPDVRLSFIQSTPVLDPVPTALRLDGIYFNTRQSWEEMNRPIRSSYESADLIVHQTDFDKRLIERYFGAHPESVVIRNAGDPGKSMSIAPLVHPTLDSFEQTWVSASSWRPHKRLRENIRYFQEHAGKWDCMVVAGQVNEDLTGVSLERVFFAGDLDQASLASLYRRATFFVHLAWLDHCPNGREAIVVEEQEWDLSPLDLYSPPSLDFSRKRSARHDHKNDMSDVAEKYAQALKRIAR